MITNFSSALTLVFKRLRYNLGLAISAMLGIVAVLAIVVCVPIFSNAVSSEVLRQQLTEKALTTRRSIFSMHMYYLDKREASAMDVGKSEAVARFITENSPRLLGLSVDRIIMEMQTIPVALKPVKVQASLDPEEPWVNMGFVSQELLLEHARLVEGKWPSVEESKEGPIQELILKIQRMSIL